MILHILLHYIYCYITLMVDFSPNPIISRISQRLYFKCVWIFYGIIKNEYGLDYLNGFKCRCPDSIFSTFMWRGTISLLNKPYTRHMTDLTIIKERSKRVHSAFSVFKKTRTTIFNKNLWSLCAEYSSIANTHINDLYNVMTNTF